MSRDDLIQAWEAHLRAFQDQYGYAVDFIYPEIVADLAAPKGITGLVPPIVQFTPLPPEPPEKETTP